MNAKRQHALELLEKRVKRLAKLLEKGQLARTIVAAEVVLIMRAMSLYDARAFEVALESQKKFMKAFEPDPSLN